ncbi:MAG: YncE family protein, partial [Candidatus Nealsonbacteria bacterium]|nr:YncE family protein [Candidatus Nealsonbacteria bacterium]
MARRSYRANIAANKPRFTATSADRPATLREGAGAAMLAKVEVTLEGNHMRIERLTSSRVRSVGCFLAVCCVLAAAEVAAADYLGPVDVVASADGKRLFVACADAKQIVVVDVVSGKVIRKIAMPTEPTGILLGPKGTRLYVTCAAPKSTVVVMDAASGKTITSIPTGHTATGPAISPDGKTLYVCNRFDNEVAVID